MEYVDFCTNKVSRLGFGCMRLPVKEGMINYDDALEMAEYAINNGINYFDTAYIYHNEKSEEFIKKVIETFGREKIFIADKLPVWLCNKEEDMQKLLDEQLLRLGTEYIDYYLMHSLYEESWEKLKSFNYKKFIEKNIANGKIKHIGFSFHDEFDLFKTIIDDYPWEFCQIQFNYLDTHFQAGIKGYNYANEKGIPLIIMEPIRGGVLAKLPENVRKVFDDDKFKNISDAHLALKFVANYENNKVILSGMHSISDMKANIDLFSQKVLTNDLNEKDIKIYEKAKDEFFKNILIKCTGCDYCKEGCLAKIAISELFKIYNEDLVAHDYDNFEWYNGLETKATACLKCGKCESVCPQNLEIITHLKTLHEYFSK